MPFDLSSARVVEEEDRIPLESEIGPVAPVNAEAPSFDIGSARVTDESAFDISSAEVSPMLSQRDEIMSELDSNPFAKKLTMQMLDTEGGGTATLEALVNRTAMIRSKVPGWKISDELTSGFYGPINSGYAQKRDLDPDSISQYQKHIDEVRSGSNVIQGRTDQGYPGDPNSHGPGRVLVADNPKEIYNYWTGRRRGVDFSHEDSAKFAMDLQGSGEGLTVEPSAPQGMLEQGNIDLSKRPIIKNPDGTISTERSFSIGEDGKEVLIPLIVNGKELSQQEAIDHYRKTGEHMGKFKDVASADAYAEIAHNRPMIEPAESKEVPAKKEVGLIESAKRGVMSSSLGIGEAVNRYAYSPVVHGISEAIQAVAPESEVAKKAKEFDDAFFKHTVEEPAAMRKKLEFDPETEKRTVAGMDLGKTGEVAGELAELGGALVPDITTAALTQGATAAKVIPTALKTAAPTILNAIKSYAPQLAVGARSFIVPSMKAGMDAAKQAKEQGASEADQNAAFLTGTLKTMAMASVPMAAESKLARLPARVASRGAQGGALAGATGELERTGSNIVLGEERPFSLVESFKQVATGGVLGPVFGRKGEPTRKLQQAKAAPQAAPAAKATAPAETLLLGDERFAPKTAPKARPAPAFEELKKEIHDLWPEAAANNLNPMKAGPWGKPLKDEFGKLPKDRQEKIEKWFEDNDDAIANAAARKHVNDRLRDIRENVDTPREFAFKIVDALRDFPDQKDYIMSGARDIIKEKGWTRQEIEPAIKKEFVQIYGAAAKEMSESFFPSKATPQAKAAPTERPALPSRGGYPALPAPEHIVGAAIQTADGQIFLGKIHTFAIEEAQKAGALPEDIFEGPKRFVSGFTTSKGRFVDAQEAFRIAKKAEQDNVDTVSALERAEEEGITPEIDATDITTRAEPPAIIPPRTPRETPPPIPAGPEPRIKPLFAFKKKIVGEKVKIGGIEADPGRLIQGTAETMEKWGFTALGQAIRDHIDQWRKYSGMTHAPIRRWAKGVNQADMAKAQDEFRNYWQSVDEQWKAQQAPGTPVTNASDALYNAASPKGREIIDISKRLFSETGDTALANKLDVFNHETGKWRPFRKIAEGKFFPRRISAAWHEILSKPLQYPEQYAEIRREAVAMGYIKQPADFDAYVSRVLKTHTPEDLSPIEHARTSPLPTRVYDYGFDQMINYLNNWSWDMARIEAFGQKSRGQLDLFEKSEGLTSDAYSKGYIRDVQNIAYRKQNSGAWSSTLNAAQTVSTISMLANYLSSMRNALGGIKYNAHYNGVSAAAKAFFRVHEMASHIDDAYERGILQDNLFNVQEDVSNLKSPLQKGLEVMFKYTGQRLAEDWTRTMNLMAARDFLRNAVEENQRDPASPKMIQIRAQLQRLGPGINTEKLLREGGQAGPLTDRFLRQNVATIQGGYQYDMTPRSLNTPGGRVIFQFQKWGTQAADIFVKNVANPAVQAISEGKLGKQETVQVPDGRGGMRTVKVPGALLPVARFLLLSTAAGLTQTELQSFIFGIEDREASFAEILSRLKKGDAKAFGDLIHKVWMANMSVGAAGVIGNYSQLLTDITQRTRFKDPSAPPALAIPKLAVGIIVDYVNQGTLTGMDLDAYARNALSAYRTVQGIGSQLNDAFGGNILPLKAVSNRNDLVFLRSRTRRYDNVIGVAPSTFGGAPPSKTALTPFTSSLKEALMMGDSLRAADLMDAHFAGKTRGQRDEEMKRIKASVRGSQPIRAGGGSGEAMAANFLDWAGENLPMTEVMRIIDIDNRYVSTATGLRLMDPRDPTMKERRAALQRIENRRAFRK